MKRAYILTLVFIFVFSGCKQQELNKIDGKIYFYSMDGFGFGSNRTGICVYENGKIKKLHKVYGEPYFSPDGEFALVILSGTKDKIRIYNLTTGEYIERSLPYRTLYGACWHPTDRNKFYYVGVANRTKLKGNWNIYEYDIKTEAVTKITNYEGLNKIWGVAASPDGSKIIYQFNYGKILDNEKKEERQVILYDLHTKTYEKLPFWSYQFDWSPDSNFIVLSGIYSEYLGEKEYGRGLIMYDVNNKTFVKYELPEISRPFDSTRQVSFSPDGKKIAFLRNISSAIWIMDKNGDNLFKVGHNKTGKSHLSWRL